LTATSAKEVEALLKEFLKFCTSAALKQHVPVTTRDLGFYFFLHDGNTSIVKEDSLLTTLGGLPSAGHLRVGSEDNFEALAIGSTVNTLLSRGKLDANFAL